MRRTVPIFVAVLMMLAGTSAALAYGKEKGMKVWKVKDLAMSGAEKIELRDEREKLIRILDGRQMALLYAVEAGIEEAANLHADFYIVDEEPPNAFATIGKDGEYLIAFTFGMLDMVGRDVDVAAAIIGHELAHLKLKHVEAKKEAQKSGSPSTSFSAAATKYTRDAERDSDYLGVIWAIEAGYDPEGAVRAHEALYKIGKRRGGSFTGSHPSSIGRITVLKSLVRRLSPR